MLRDEIAKYTELSGNDGEHTPICVIGAYLDGYDKGKDERISVFDSVRAEIGEGICTATNDYDRGRNYGLYMAKQIIDKYLGGYKDDTGKSK